MSLADALNPHLPENIPLHGPYPVHDAEQPAPIDQDEEMDDLFDEDAVVDQADRYSIPPMVHTTAIHRRYVGTLSQTHVGIRRRAGGRDFGCRTASSRGNGIRGGGRTRSGQRPRSARTTDRSFSIAPEYPFTKKLGWSGVHLP